jgi:hypothetical protein
MTEPIMRFLQKIVVSEELSFQSSPCWEWIGCKTRFGYGQFKVDAKNSSPHRFAHEYFNGKIPDGFEVDHLCKVRHCCNPLHLEAITLFENRNRMNQSQTHCKYGHELCGDNIRIDPRFGRICRACNRNRQMAHRRKRYIK